MEVAAIRGNTGRVQSSGTIERGERRFIILVEGEQVGASDALDGAAHRLTREIGNRLDRSLPWGLVVSCQLNGLAVAFGNQAAGGSGGGSLHPCAAEMLAGKSFDDIGEALRAAADLIRTCCRQ